MNTSKIGSIIAGISLGLVLGYAAASLFNSPKDTWKLIPYDKKWPPTLGHIFLKLRCERSGVHYPTSFLTDSEKYTSSGVSLTRD